MGFQQYFEKGLAKPENPFLQETIPSYFKVLLFEHSLAERMDSTQLVAEDLNDGRGYAYLI